MSSFLLALRLLSLVASLSSIATSADGSIAGGSGDHKDNLLTPFVVSSTPWPLQCRIPPYSDPARIKTYPLGVTVEQNGEVLAAEGRCYSACAPSVTKFVRFIESDDSW